jgi:hypothetical protein
MKRPFGVTFLAIMVVFAAICNGLRISETIFFWKTLAEYGVHPLYIAISGGVWLLADLFLLWSLWQGKTWSQFAVFSSAAGYAAWYWFDRLVLQKPHANWPFALVATVVSLLIILHILFLRSTRLFFQRDL